MMSDVLWLTRKQWLAALRNYRMLLLYFGLPIIGIALAMLTQSGAETADLKMGIVNEDGDQAIANDVIQFISGLDHMQIRMIEAEDVRPALASGELDAAITLPSGFAQSARSGKLQPVQLVSIKGAQVTAYVNMYLNLYMDNMAAIGHAAAGDEGAFDALYAGYAASEFKLANETLPDQSVDYNRSKQTIGYLLILMMFSAANLSGMLIKERENRTYLRILSSPVHAGAYIVSNIIVSMAVMMLQIAVTLIVMTKLFGIESGVSFGSLFLILVLFALVALSLSFMITAYSRSSLQATALQNMLILPTSLLAGSLFPLELMPAFLQGIADLLPQHWLLDTLGKLQLGSSLWSLYLNLIILLAFAAVLSLIAMYRMGRNDDTRRYI